MVVVHASKTRSGKLLECRKGNAYISSNLLLVILRQGRMNRPKSVFVISLLGLLLSFRSGEKPSRTFELLAQSSRFWNLIDHDAKLTLVARGFGFTEGPVWNPAGFLYVSDEEQNKIYRLYLDGRKETLVELEDPDGNTLDEQQRLLDCASVLHAIVRVSPDGKYKTLVDRYQGKRLNSPQRCGCWSRRGNLLYRPDTRSSKRTEARASISGSLSSGCEGGLTAAREGYVAAQRPCVLTRWQAALCRR